jgi:alpha-L-arabinofuranosidase
VPDPARVTVSVNVDIPGPVIGRHLYGHFAEHLGRCIYEPAQSARSLNSAEHPEDVSPQPLELASTATGARLTVPPTSFTIVAAA